MLSPSHKRENRTNHLERCGMTQQPPLRRRQATTSSTPTMQYSAQHAQDFTSLLHTWLQGNLTSVSAWQAFTDRQQGGDDTFGGFPGTSFGLIPSYSLCLNWIMRQLVAAGKGTFPKHASETSPTNRMRVVRWVYLPCCAPKTCLRSGIQLLRNTS